MKKIRLINPKSDVPVYALVDDQDYEWLMQWEWRLALGYAVRRVVVDRIITPENMGSGERVRNIQMGREILKQYADMDGLVCDHVDGVRLNNQRENLRPATKAQNRANAGKDRRKKPTSRYKGVSLVNGKWIAQGKWNGKQRRFGTFATEDEAARAYNRFAKTEHGEFARLNVIGEGIGKGER